MTIQEFAEQVIETLKSEFPSAEFHTHQVEKPGNKLLTGIAVQTRKSNACPLFYVDDFYDAKKSAKETAQIIAKEMSKHELVFDSLNVSSLVDSFESASKHIVPRLIDIRPGRNDGYIKNRVVKKLPCKTIGVIYDVELPGMVDRSMGIPVTKNLQKYWQVSIKMIHDAALCSGPKIYPASVNALLDITIVTNSIGAYGAAVILYSETKKMLDKRFPDGFVLLPSSIHEFIVLPKERASDLDELLAMVKNINETTVSLEDQLADDVFLLDAKGQLVSAFKGVQ